MNLDVLSIAIQTREPILCWGPPGTGKTSITRGIGHALGMPVEIVMSSIREPTDFAGLPIVSGDEVKLAAPDWAKRILTRSREDEQSTLLFFDEISTAPPAVQAPLLRVCLDKVVGDVQLPEDTAIIAAANPPEQAAGGWDLAPPLANRFLHMEWRMDNDVWIDGMLSGFPEPTTKRIDPEWRRGIPEARSLVASYIKVRPTQLFDLPTEETAAGKAWASPRSWDMAARLYAAAQAYPVTEDRRKEILIDLLGGCVGNGKGLEFLTWIDALDLPDPEKLLAFPTKFRLPKRGDQVFAVLSSVVTAVSNNMNPDRWMAAWTIIDIATREGTPDIAASAAKTLVRARKEQGDMHSYPMPVEQFKALMPILLAAGYVPGQ